MGALCFLRFVGLIRAKQSLRPYLDNHPALDLKYFSGGIQIITQMGLILFTVLHEKYRQDRGTSISQPLFVSFFLYDICDGYYRKSTYNKLG